MRILLAGPLDVGNATYREVDQYRLAGHDVVVNTAYFDQAQASKLAMHYQSDARVAFSSFDPANSDALLAEITKGNTGYDAIVYPPDLRGFTADIVEAARDAALAHLLKVVGCPNDVVRHLSEVKQQGIPVINSSDIHKQAVAEYTLSQMGFHARRIGHFYAATGGGVPWPHDEAVSTGSSLAGKTLGVIGVTGKDGRAVAQLGKRMGLRVIGLGSGSQDTGARIRDMGVEIASDLEQLLEQSDFISINSAKEKTLGLIGKDQFALMKPGVIIVNPAGAEIIDKQALYDEFSTLPENRKVGVLILDMPYGGRQGDKTFSYDPDNARLKSCGVFFTPRMAGYTVDTYTCGVEEVADSINQLLLSSGPHGQLTLDELAQTIVALVRQVGERAIQLRKAGLVIQAKQDGTLFTNADVAAEEIIRDGLRRKGYDFNITGEEIGRHTAPGSAIEVIIDGIDGTRNFRDDNYGWCTSVCVQRDGQSVIGIVHDPKSGETFGAIKGKGAFRSDGITREPLKTPENHPADFSFSVGSFRICGSTAVKNQIVEEIKKLGGRQREWGSVALSVCGAARGGLGSFIQGNATFHDYAAALLIAEEAGAGISSTPSQGTGKKDIIVAHPLLLQQIRDIVATRIASLPSPSAP